MTATELTETARQYVADCRRGYVADRRAIADRRDRARQTDRRAELDDRRSTATEDRT